MSLPVTSTRPVPNLIGETRMGTTMMPLAPDTKRSSEFPLFAAARITKISVGIDGNGGAAPTTTATLRGAVYQGNILLGSGSEVTVVSGMPLSWVDLPLAPLNPTGVAVTSGEVEFAVLVGGTPGLVRVAQIDPDPPYGGGRSNNDTYSDGPSNPYGAAVSTSAAMSIFGTITPDWFARDATSFDVVARMGFLEAQRLLAGLLTTETYEATTSWHGTRVDANRGSFAVVLAGGALAGLVGKRLLVTSKTHAGRSCLVYVTAAVSSLDADISLARRAFAQLELMSADTLDVHLRVVD